MLYCNACLVPILFPTWFCAAGWIKLIYYAAKVLDSALPDQRWMPFPYVRIQIVAMATFINVSVANKICIVALKILENATLCLKRNISETA